MPSLAPLRAPVPPKNDTLQEFLGEQVTSVNFYYLVLATFTITLMAMWRKFLKDDIYWGGME